MVHWKILITNLLLLICAAPAQTDIDFRLASRVENVDVFSFAPQMMLKHEIGDFQKLFKNPVLKGSKGQWDARDAADPFVLVTDSDILLFYDGDKNDRYHIGYARLSNDGWFWEKQGRILAPAEGWNGYHLIDPVVIAAPGNWRLWYSGNSTDSPLGYAVGHAVSRNGTEWRSDPQEAVLAGDPQQWDAQGIAYTDILYDPVVNLFKMWYSGFSGPVASFGYATSPDGLKWTKYKNNPVYAVLPGVIAPDVKFDGGIYRMYYAQLYFKKGMRTKISLAESEDGIHWKFIKDVLKPREKWEGGKLMSPCIAFFNQKVHLFYCAQKGSRWAIGEATATARFESAGVWESREFTESLSQLEIVYEMPPLTKLTVEVKHSSCWIEVHLSDPSRLTYGRLRSKIRSEPFSRVKIKLESEDPSFSPVLYSCKLDK